MNERILQDARRAVSLIPSGLWVMTASFEGKRAGVLVKSVCPCADEPLLLAVAAWKGHGIEPIIRDSHHFAVSLLDPEDRLAVRKFTGHLADHLDQFDTVQTERLVSGAPVLVRSKVSFDCEVVRHFDMEADHELYIGLVLGARTGATRDVAQMPPPHSGGTGVNGHANGHVNGHANGHSNGHANGHKKTDRQAG